MRSDIQKVRFTGLKASATRVLTHPLIGKSLGMLFSDRIPCRGVRVDTRANVTDEVKAKLFWGIYESSEIRFIQQYLRPDLDVVELSSSLGVVASHIAQRIAGRRLICVEANPSLKETIQANLRANAGAVDCRVVEAAIDYDATGAGVTGFVKGRNNLDSRAARMRTPYGRNRPRFPHCCASMPWASMRWSPTLKARNSASSSPMAPPWVIAGRSSRSCMMRPSSNGAPTSRI